MSFCATWVLFDSSGRSLRSQQRSGPSSLNLFCEVGLELFSSKVISLRPLSGPEVTSKESHYLTPNCCGNFLSNKHHHWVRDNSWVQIIIIKVIYSLAREDLLVTINTHELSQWGKTERDREREIDKKRAREPEIRSSKRARERARAKGKQFWSVL